MTLHITSPQNPRIKSAARLRNARDRAQQQRIIIDGVREIGRAIEAGVEIVELFVCPDECQEPAAKEAMEAVRSHGSDVITVSTSVLEKIAFGDRSEGMVAVAHTPRHTLAEIDLPALPLVAVIEAVEKPGNVGAILRTADAAGVSGVIVAEAATDLFNPNTIRASLGAVFTMPACAAASEEILPWLRERGLMMYASRVDASMEYTAADFTKPAAILLGSEAAGLSPVWQAGDITDIRLPMHGTVDSLNVSATAAVLFYEALRQRKM